MNDLAVGIWVAFKWFIPVAIGSGLSVFLDKTEKTTKAKCWLFLFGASISVILGGVLVEHYPTLSSSAQGLIYFSIGLWGMGIVVQINEKIKPATSRIIDKCEAMVLRWLEKF